MNTVANATGVNKGCCLPPCSGRDVQVLTEHFNWLTENAAFIRKTNWTQEEPKKLGTDHRVSGKNGQVTRLLTNLKNMISDHCFPKCENYIITVNTHKCLAITDSL